MIDIVHLLQRLDSAFNTESRFYWPVVVGIFLAAVVHTLWYLFRPSKPRNPVRDQLEAVAYWVNIVALILLLVLVSAKATPWTLIGVIVVEWAGLAFLYLFYAPPRFAEWDREQRKRKFIPEPRRRAARR